MITIDFEILDQLLEAGCDGTQCAAYFGCSFDTLSRRVKEIKDADFADYKAQKRAKGDVALLTAQFDAAVKEKDRGMLIWLGKQRLEQKDKAAVDNNITGMGINIQIKPQEGCSPIE